MLYKNGMQMYKCVKIIIVFVALAGCNSVHMKPNTMDTGAVVYADRGGYSMRRSVKETLEGRGYTVLVGTVEANEMSETIDRDKTKVPTDAKYVIKVSERGEKFRPIWCALNGFWWWNFNMSIADQKTGTEIMTWRARGCANSSIRMLNRILDKLEK